MYPLTGADGAPVRSSTPGTIGGHRRSRIYGRLDCPAALRAIHAGGYVAHRVFFADGTAAVAAGYRPCAVCLPAEYQRWKRLVSSHRPIERIARENRRSGVESGASRSTQG